MKRFGEELNNMHSGSFTRPIVPGNIASTGNGGKTISINNAQGSVQKNMLSLSPYGFASTPPSGLLAFSVVSDSGGRDGVIGVYDPKKPTCAVGNSVMYSSGGANVKCSGSTVTANGRDFLKEIDGIEEGIGDIKEIKEIKEDIKQIKAKIGM